MLVIRSLIRRGPFLIRRSSDNFYQRILGNYCLLTQDFPPEVLIFLAAAPFEDFKLPCIRQNGPADRFKLPSIRQNDPADRFKLPSIRQNDPADRFKLPSIRQNGPADRFKWDGGDKGAVYQNVSIVHKIQLDILNQFLNRVLLYQTGRLTWQDQVYLSVMLYKLGIRNTQEFLSVLKQAAGREMGKTESRESKPNRERHFLVNSVYRRLWTAEVYRDVLRSRTIGYETSADPVSGELLLLESRKQKPVAAAKQAENRQSAAYGTAGAILLSFAEKAGMYAAQKGITEPVWINWQSAVRESGKEKIEQYLLSQEEMNLTLKSETGTLAYDYVKHQYGNSDKDILKVNALKTGKMYRHLENDVYGKAGKEAAQLKYRQLKYGQPLNNNYEADAVRGEQEDPAAAFKKTDKGYLQSLYKEIAAGHPGTGQKNIVRVLLNKEQEITGKEYPRPGNKPDEKGYLGTDYKTINKDRLSLHREIYDKNQNTDNTGAALDASKEIQLTGMGGYLKLPQPADLTYFQAGREFTTIGSDFDGSTWSKTQEASYVFKPGDMPPDSSIPDLEKYIRDQLAVQSTIWKSKKVLRDLHDEMPGQVNKKKSMIRPIIWLKKSTDRQSILRKYYLPVWKRTKAQQSGRCYRNLPGERLGLTVRVMQTEWRKRFSSFMWTCPGGLEQDISCKRDAFGERLKFSSLFLFQYGKRTIRPAALPYLKKKAERQLAKARVPMDKAEQSAAANGDLRIQTGALQVKTVRIRSSVQTLFYPANILPWVSIYGNVRQKSHDKGYSQEHFQRYEKFYGTSRRAYDRVIKMTGSKPVHRQGDNFGQNYILKWLVKQEEEGSCFYAAPSVNLKKQRRRDLFSGTKIQKRKKDSLHVEVGLHRMHNSLTERVTVQKSEMFRNHQVDLPGSIMKPANSNVKLVKTEAGQSQAETVLQDDGRGSAERFTQRMKPAERTWKFELSQDLPGQLPAEKTIPGRNSKTGQKNNTVIHRSFINKIPVIETHRIAEAEAQSIYHPAASVEVLKHKSGENILFPATMPANTADPNMSEDVILQRSRELRLKEMQLNEQQFKEQQIKELQEIELRIKEWQTKEPQTRKLRMKEWQTKEPQTRKLRIKEWQTKESQEIELRIKEWLLKELQAQELRVKEIQTKEPQLKEFQTKDLQMREREVRRMVQKNVQEQVELLTDQVYRRLERRLLSEKKRRGL